MAHIQMNRLEGPTGHLIVNGVDLTLEVYSDTELVVVGDEVGLRITLGISSLELEGETAEITNNFPTVAARVRDLVGSQALGPGFVPRDQKPDSTEKILGHLSEIESLLRQQVQDIRKAGTERKAARR